MIFDVVNFESILFLIGFSFLISSCGVILLWREKTNLVHSASHSSSLAISLVPFLFGGFLTSSILAAICFSCLIVWFEKIKLSENESISTTGTFVMIAGFAIEVWQNGSQNLSKYLIGDIFLISQKDSILIFLFAVFVWILYFSNLKTIVISVIYKKEHKLFSSNFLKILEIYLIIYVSKMVGVLCASIPIIFIPLIIRKIAKNPRQMMVLTLILSFLFLFFSYILAIYFNYYFSLVMIVVILFSFVFAFL